jgi:hypothetical protein
MTSTPSSSTAGARRTPVCATSIAPEFPSPRSPRRSGVPSTYSSRGALLGILARRVPLPWSELEDQLLRSAVKARVLTTALAGWLERSADQVRARRCQLGLASRTARRHTPAEDAVLRDEWAAGVGVEPHALRLGRSPDAVRVHADGLTCQRIADDLGRAYGRRRRGACPQASGAIGWKAQPPSSARLPIDAHARDAPRSAPGGMSPSPARFNRRRAHRGL